MEMDTALEIEQLFELSPHPEFRNKNSCVGKGKRAAKARHETVTGDGQRP